MELNFRRSVENLKDQLDDIENNLKILEVKKKSIEDEITSIEVL